MEGKGGKCTGETDAPKTELEKPMDGQMEWKELIP